MSATATAVPLLSKGGWGGVVRAGLLGAAVAIYLCLVGIVPTFGERSLIDDVVTLGQAFVLLTALAVGYFAALRVPQDEGGQRSLRMLLGGTIAGAITGFALTVLVILGSVVDLRAVAQPASPQLYDLLTFGLGTTGAWLPSVVGALLGALAGASLLLPVPIRRALLVGLGALLVLGLFASVLRTPMLGSGLAGLARFLFASEGLTLVGAVITVVIATVGDIVLRAVDARRRIARLSDAQRRVALPPVLIVALVVIVLLPQGLGPLFAQVIALVALYILMGLGLNITLGLAGLLDLGFVAFFAVGAYTVGLLTSTAEFGIAQWPFWAAVPFAVLLAMLFGAILGLPILGIRGDYLAIVTLAFGEIIRILAGSDLMKPFLGGPRGIINIPKPIDVAPDHFLAGPQQIYYISLLCAGVIAFVAWRLRDSRIGRAWVAIREDEDVAEAMGVNLVQTKLMAYMLGAAFAGLGGAIFAGLVGSIFASSVQLIVSINVVALIIVGGMGSIPGVVVGAIFLIGLPELFREFSEYRFLFYGIALIMMMRLRPEGLLPSRIVRRELHLPENVEPPGAPVGSNAAAQAQERA